jgi:DNA-binding Lrp family transcriptional regulator
MIDLIDLEILRILQKDARTPVIEISKELGISRPTVKSRVENLQKDGVIKKFTAIIDRDAVLNNILLLIEMTINDRKALESLAEMSEILEIYETLDDKNHICKAIVSNMEELRTLIDKISELDIKNIDSKIVLRTIKEEYEAIVGPEIGVAMDCEYCSNPIHGAPVKFKIHNKEHYFCCPVCLKGYKKRTSHKA